MSIVYSAQMSRAEMSRVDELTLSTHTYHLTGGGGGCFHSLYHAQKGFNSIEICEEVSSDTYILCTNDTYTWERYWLWLDDL